MRTERTRPVRIAVLAAAAWTLVLAPAAAAAVNPEGPLSWAAQISLAPTCFDERPWLITPFMVLYALHDALRRNVTFHNGEPLTAEDVRFSFERYRSTATKLLDDKVAAVEVVDRFRVRFPSRSRGRTS